MSQEAPEPFSIEVGGASLACWELGEGLPVVFLHAGVCDSRMWRNQMQAVADSGWRAIAYDRRGHGETRTPDEPFNHLDDLATVLDALDLHAALLVGCSMGGGLAVDFALANPGRVLGLVLIGTSVTGAPWSTSAEEQGVEMAEEDAWERGDLDLVNRVEAHAWLDGPRGPGGRVGDPARSLFLDMNRIILNAPQLTMEEARPDAWNQVGAINAPTMLLVGSEDFACIIDRHETLSETMPNAFAMVIEGAAHLPSIERPEFVSRLIDEFLDALDGDDEHEESID
ncbi:MAG: alpha/beta hydrolase [Devosia sp.]|uniref:alpha/beta fold hydrolase n=1 Tax=Devosia sp. TaxID=1871048 RepID=UPI0024C6DC57|nr:alpha/beta hydrolase [Devosia sp.]UYO00798.1 MAG: alpha/beta hydrolase [Devosia sp.]